MPECLIIKDTNIENFLNFELYYKIVECQTLKQSPIYSASPARETPTVWSKQKLPYKICTRTQFHPTSASHPKENSLPCIHFFTQTMSADDLHCPTPLSMLTIVSSISSSLKLMRSLNIYLIFYQRKIWIFNFESTLQSLFNTPSWKIEISLSETFFWLTFSTYWPRQPP